MDSEAVIEFLGDVPVLQRFPSSSIRKIAQFVVVKRYNSGEYIFREEKTGDGIYIICEGEVEVSSAFRADNHECQVLQWRKFDYFTQNESVAEEDIIALTKVTLLMLPHKFSPLMQPKSIWSADMNLETLAPVEHILSLDPLDMNTFRGTTLQGAPKSSNALAAASKTVHFLKILHSFHAHFLLAGDINIPIIYQVDRLHDVPNLATRRVNAVQKERLVFFLIASFHRGEEGIEVSTPTSVPWPTEIRPVDPVKHTRQTARSPSDVYWLRAKACFVGDAGGCRKEDTVCFYYYVKNITLTHLRLKTLLYDSFSQSEIIIEIISVSFEEII
ncbi:Acyl-CoA thioesterase [Cynara cardunculus var. scolymus]|uniref:Acyl-CoA thioesterase n=1 Tax=Cynara cardunculus var. scolymus TaxID=59895 RepID=A0A103XE80_CYNCS|nr:Acyl-CoA thioesterase [Cynara cardunculus var. scolymus]